MRGSDSLNALFRIAVLLDGLVVRAVVAIAEGVVTAKLPDLE